MSTYDLKLTDHRCQLTNYYLLFTTIRSDLMREKKKNFGRKFEKKWWLKKEQAVCMIRLPKLLWWPKLTTNLYKKFWWQVRLYYCKFSSPINQLTKKNTTPKCFLSKQKRGKKMAFKNKKQKKPKLYDTASYCVWVYLVIFVNKSCFQKRTILTPLSICTWFLKNQVWKIKFNKLDF